MKFRTLDSDLSNVSKLPDTPTLENGYTPDALKKTFDRAGEQIREYINGVLIEELESFEAQKSGADKIGSGYIETVSGSSVQEKLENLASQVQDISNATIPDGTITPEKFLPSVEKFITEGSEHYAFYSEPGTYTFIPTRNGNHRITVQGAGGGGSTIDTYSVPCGGSSGAACIGWFFLEKGKEYTVNVGEGGKCLTLNENSKLVSEAEKGGSSSFFDGETELLFADGGGVKKNISGVALSRGGVICKSGEFPLVSDIKYSDTLSFAIGAPSHFSSCTKYYTIEAGAGAGGYGADYSLSLGKYSTAGSRGGNGAVLIEWME